ncbi:MAG: alpha/beta hydrolase [Acidobacteria bacterium]|nr:alpha/beta hydrolase [Acidobacteriota bacterium]
MPIIRRSEERLLVEYWERPAISQRRYDVVLLHGWGCSPRFFFTLMNALPPDCRARALNLLYYRKGSPAKEPTIVGFAELVSSFIGDQPTVLAGHSMGGVVAQAVVMAEAPVERLILIGTGPNMKNHPVATAILEKAERDGFSYQFLEWTMRRFFKDAPSDLREYMEDVSQGDSAVMLAAMKSLFATDLEPQLHRIKCPTLILHGRHDAARSLDHVERLRSGIQNHRVVLFDTGHSPMLEAPEAFNRHFIEFLGGRHEST